jgi:ankyrin repeat protein
VNHGVLWVKGKPGAGKSTLMKRTLQHCEETLRGQLIVSYFFNARGDQLEKTCLGMLRSIVWQLFQRDEGVRVRFTQRFREKELVHETGRLEWRLSDLRDFVSLEIGGRIACPVALLVDALDECSDSDVRDVVELLEAVSIKASRSGAKVRICLSSRHYPSINMKQKLEFVLEDKPAHQEDIACYVRERLESDDERLQTEIERKANGIFLWAILVVNILNKASRDGCVEEMEKVLDDLPGDLEAIFSAILGDNEADKAETVLMLQWVLFSRQPLTPEELYIGAVTEAAPKPQGPWDRSRVTGQMIERRITSSSKGLIEIRKGGDRPEAQFIHRSVSDFLHRNQRLCRLDPSLGQDPGRTSHKRLWRCCWKYIEQFDRRQTSKADFEDASVQYPFLKYALGSIFELADGALPVHGPSQHWTNPSTWLSVLYNPERFTTSEIEILQWLKGHGRWFMWWKRGMRVLGVNLHNHEEVKEEIELLYLFSANRYSRLVHLLLASEDIDVNAQGGLYGNALQAASVGGSVEVVQLLLDKGAEVNAQGGQYGNALQAASVGGSVEVVQLLLDKGAEVNAQGSLYGNALQAASWGGSVEVVQLLLDKGAEVNAQGGLYGNALQAASIRGSVEVVQLLLDKGAEVTAQGGTYGNALQAASVGGSVEVVQLLLDKGAEVNAQGGTYGNALQAASWRGSVEVVQLLLDKGAEVNAQGGEFGNALQAALSRSRDTVIKVLRENGAEYPD